MGGGLWDQQERPKQIGKFPAIEVGERKPRTKEEMNKEASFFKEQMAFVDGGES